MLVKNIWIVKIHIYKKKKKTEEKKRKQFKKLNVKIYVTFFVCLLRVSAIMP